MIKKDKADDVVIFDEVKIGNLNVKPWSFGMLFEASPILEEVIMTLEKKDVRLDELIDELGNISFVNIAKLFTIASGSIFKIMVMSVTSKKSDVEKEIRELSMEDGVKLFLAIYTQNKDKIKNALNPLMMEVQDDQRDEKEVA